MRVRGGVLALASFRVFFVGQIVSTFGNILMSIILIMFIRDGHGAGSIALVLAIGAVPPLVLAPVVGSLVDRAPTLRIMIVADVIRAGLVCSFAFMPDILTLCVVYFFYSLSGVFFNPARARFLPGLVSQIRVGEANSLLQSAASVSVIAAPLVAGALYGAELFNLGLFINAGTFLLSAVTLSWLKEVEHDYSRSRLSLIENLRAGLKQITGSRLVSSVIAADVVVAFVLAVIYVVEVMFVTTILELPTSAWGILVGIVGAGTLVGSLVLAYWDQKIRRREVWFFGAVVLFGVTLVLFGLNRDVLLAGVIMAVQGFAQAVVFAYGQTVLQQNIPLGLLGRVFAFKTTAGEAVRLLATAIAVPVAVLIGYSNLFVAIGCCLLVTGISCGYRGSGDGSGE